MARGWAELGGRSLSWVIEIPSTRERLALPSALRNEPPSRGLQEQRRRCRWLQDRMKLLEQVNQSLVHRCWVQGARPFTVRPRHSPSLALLRAAKPSSMRLGPRAYNSKVERSGDAKTVSTLDSRTGSSTCGFAGQEAGSRSGAAPKPIRRRDGAARRRLLDSRNQPSRDPGSSIATGAPSLARQIDRRRRRSRVPAD